MVVMTKDKPASDKVASSAGEKHDKKPAPQNAQASGEVHRRGQLHACTSTGAP